jgi:N-acetylmuramoyl-L-alanine amidase
MVRVVLLCFVALSALWPQSSQLSAQSLNESLTLISSDGRQTIRTIRERQRDMVALDDLAEIFELEIDDSSDGTAHVTSGGQIIIITADQQLVSVAGRLVSLRTAPRRADGQWLVPLDFLIRALNPILDVSLELRARSRMVLVGDVVVPRISGQYQPRNGSAELALEVTPSTPYTVDQENGRLVVRFEADAIDLDQLPAPQGDLFIGITPDTSSVGLLIDLGPAFETFSVSSRPTQDNGVELIIELSASPRTTESVPTTTPTLPGLGSSAGFDPLPTFTTPRPTVRVVAVDAGHGGNDDGTQGAIGTLEKDITLSIARRLRDQLEDRLGLRVNLTRNRDDDVPIDARAAIANNNKADLFISLHVNASIRQSATGAEVSYLSMENYGEETRAITEREAKLVPVIGGNMRQINFVQWDMAQLQHLDQSARLANIMHEELSRRVPMSTRGVQEAPFRVLVGANMPAVLIEMGFISNQDDEQRLRSTQFQNAVVNALTDSVLRFRSYIETVSAPLSDTTNTNQPDDAQVRNE